MSDRVLETTALAHPIRDRFRFPAKASSDGRLFVIYEIEKTDVRISTARDENGFDGERYRMEQNNHPFSERVLQDMSSA